MESLCLTYKLVDLKIKSKVPFQIYFMSDKRQKYENQTLENLFIFAATRSLSGRRGEGGGCCTGIWTKGE